MKSNENPAKRPYLSSLGALALAFGCAVGWGAFVMPGTTFLPVAGPLGTAIGIGLGGLVMALIAVNYHTLMKRYPEGGGGAYTYTKKCFGYDHGFLASWFMVLTYIAIIWANATALPLIANIIFPGAFRFGFLYQVAGFKVYLGEILLSIAALAIGALVCFCRRLASRTQIVMAIALFLGVVICFVGAAIHNGGTFNGPSFSPKMSGFDGTLTIFALAPWAYVGFESISHSSGEAKFPMKRALPIMVIAVIASAIAYAFLAILATTSLPEGAGSWVDYLANLSSYKGEAAWPTFFGASQGLGTAGSIIIGIAALCAIFTGIIGNYTALSRLTTSTAEDGLLPGAVGKIDRYGVPKIAILLIFGISAILPFFGRTAISWIVDVTTVGATIAFAFTSASAFKVGRKEKDKVALVFAIIGLVISFIFALVFLVPNILSVSTLSTESYFILAAWGILGFIVFLIVLHRDTHRRFGRSTVAWIVLLGLIIFASAVWMRQSASARMDASIAEIEESFAERLARAVNDTEMSALEASLREAIDKVETSILISTILQTALIVVALIILFLIYGKIQKREKQIEVEKAIAEDHSRAKTSFLSNMSHEIRTPMNAIIGLDSIALRDPGLTPRTKEHLEKIGASARHLLGLINDILDMSRIESGRMTLKNEEFLFHDLIEQVSIIINGQCLEKGLHYECVVLGEVNDYFVGDDMKLKQVLINLLGNAVKFTSQGPVFLPGEEEGREGDMADLTFTIEDTGIGMEKDFIPRIFDAFSQEDATNTNRYGGSGLGMAITKSFVEMMSGSIEIESEKGVGSKFTVRIRLQISDKTYQSASGMKLQEGLNALILDDDEIACEHAEVVLHSLGVASDRTSSPEEALALAKKAMAEGKPYDIVLSDYRMPSMNGLEFAKAIRELDKGKSALFLVTGYNSDILDGEVDKNGVDGIIAKPLFTDNLMSAILSSFEKKGIFKRVAEEKEAEAEQISLSGLRVLMAEDVDANAEILADLLELEDILSERAENGEEAIRMFVERPAHYYDAILMDVRMPVKDGLVATREIRALDKEDAKTIPIIAMTANVFDEDVERCLSVGMNSHLAKPIEPDKLYGELRRFAKSREE